MNRNRATPYLYTAICQLSEEHRSHPRMLEEYLRALWRLGSGWQDRAALRGDEFLELLSEAFRATPAPFDEAWRERYDLHQDAEAGFLAWESRILRQIVDLREMEEAGLLSDSVQCYFGVDAPRGGRWYNTWPGGFLECAATGSLGWCSVRERDRHNTKNALLRIAVSWDDLRGFLYLGQIYE